MNKYEVVSLNFFETKGFEDQQAVLHQFADPQTIQSVYKEAVAKAKAAENADDNDESAFDFGLQLPFYQDVLKNAHKAILQVDRETPRRDVHIVDGWDKERYAFILHLTEQHAIGGIKHHYLIGHTSAIEGKDVENIDMQVTTYLRGTQNPDNEDVVIRDSTNLIYNQHQFAVSNIATIRRDHTTRPVDVIGFAQRPPEDDIIDLRQVVSNIPKSSSLLNNLSAYHLMKYLESIWLAIKLSPSDSSPHFNSICSTACGIVSDNASQLINLLSAIAFHTEGQNAPGVFTFKGLKLRSDIPPTRIHFVKQREWIPSFEQRKQHEINFPYIAGVMHAIQTVMLNSGVFDFNFRMVSEIFKTWGDDSVVLPTIVKNLSIDSLTRFGMAQADTSDLARMIVSALTPYKNYLSDMFGSDSSGDGYIEFCIDVGGHSYIGSHHWVQFYPWFAHALLSPVVRPDDAKTNEYLNNLASVLKMQFEELDQEA